MSTPSTLIIVNGASGTGKTHLSRRLARELRLPLLSKDDIKEGLYDELSQAGPDGFDLAWSRKLGGASFDALFRVIEQQLAAGVDCITETAFNPKFNTSKFLDLKAQYGYRPFQIYCHCEAAVLADRVNKRYGSGERHPVHPDFRDSHGGATPELIRQIEASGKYGILEIGGALISVDTTNLAAIDFEGLVKRIRAVL